MKITDLHIDGFGIWTGLSVDQLPDDATVFFGRNEAGKTTLMQFVRALLYGFSPQRRERYLPPVHGGLPGGTLYVGDNGRSDGDGAYEIQRHATANPDDVVGELAVFSADGAVEADARLVELLAGIDEPIFNNVFAVGLREMQELGTLNDTQAAELLYRLTSGVDRVSLVEVMRELNEARARLLSPDGHPAEITSLLERRHALEEEAARHVQKARRWPALYGQQQLLEAEVRELQQAIGRLERQTRVVELAVQLRERWEQRASLGRRLEETHALPQLPERAIPRLERAKQKVAARRERLADIKQQRTELRAEAAALPLNRELWRERARIEAVAEHAQWIASLESQIARLNSEVALLEVEHESQWGGLGIEGAAAGGVEGGGKQLPEISRGVIASLREPARAMREQNEKLQQARKDHDAGLEEAQRLTGEVESALAECGETELVESLERKGELVSQLRRRIQLEERIEQLHRHRDELEDQSHDLLDGQVLSVRVLMLLGALFISGVMLILTGLLGGVFFSLASGLGWALAVLGFGGLGAAVAWKVMLERSARLRLESCNHQLEVVSDEIHQAREERGELDKQLPGGGGALDVRMSRAEEELKQLEAVLPLDAARRAAAQRADAAQLRIAQAEEALDEAKHRWRETLRSAGLPPKLSPRQIKQVAQRSQSLGDVRGRLSERRQELEQRRSELASVQSRIEQLAEDVGLLEDGDDPHAEARGGEATYGNDNNQGDQNGDEPHAASPPGEGPQPLLRRLTAELAVQRGWFEKRRSLSRQERTLKRERSRVVAGIKKLFDYRRVLLAQAGVTDEAGLRELAHKHDEADRMRGQHEELCRQIAAALGAGIAEDEIAAVLAEGSPDELEQRWDALVSRLEDEQERLAELHERRGAMKQEMKSLAEDRRLAETRLELGAVRRRLRAAVQRWRVLASAGLLLERIRETYERERQPETLREASRFLEQLTEGQYVRVWTPLDQDVLRVDNREGQPLSIELLSRGTREAVFLALRLALIAQYAQRGTVLPVVLDDVLVNFDAQRTKAAARVLRDFSRDGHQLLLFTCHEHIMKVFRKLKVEIRELPAREVLLARQEAKDEPAAEPETDELPEGDELPYEEEVLDAVEGLDAEELPEDETEFETAAVLADESEIEWSDEPVDEYDEPVEEETIDEEEEEIVDAVEEEDDDATTLEDEDYAFADEDELALAREPFEQSHFDKQYEDDVESERDEAPSTDDDAEYTLGPEPDQLPVAPLLDNELLEEYRLADDEELRLADNPPRLTFRQRPASSDAKARAKSEEPPPRQSSFTWESPEMWWRDRSGDAA